MKNQSGSPAIAKACIYSAEAESEAAWTAAFTTGVVSAAASLEATGGASVNEGTDGVSAAEASVPGTAGTKAVCSGTAETLSLIHIYS